jgi:hypothetical protein
MAQKRTRQFNCRSSPVDEPRLSRLEKQEAEVKEKRLWSTITTTATYRYLVEGIRILGRAYSTNHDPSASALDPCAERMVECQSGETCTILGCRNQRHCATYHRARSKRDFR